LEEHARHTWDLARAVLARDAEQGWNLLQHPARLPVLTIDALSASLARRMPLSSGLGALPNVTEDASAAYREAARRTLTEAPLALQPAWRTLLAHLDNNVRAILELIAGMLERRDQWLKHVVGADDGSLRERIEEALAKEIRFTLRHAINCLSESDADE